jgi:CHASE2 domain-containing sensor protein
VERDLSALPKDMQAAARIDANGEVSWPDSAAAAAISALADTGALVLGLDVRFYDADDRFYEIAWSSFDPDRSKPSATNRSDARDAALARLANIDELELPDDTVERRVLITWD